jgi:signal transduction histidine kinase
MDPIKQINRLKFISILALSVFGILFLIFQRLTLEKFSVWFTPGFIITINIIAVIIFSVIFFIILFSKIRVVIMVMKHYQDELKDATLSMKRLQEETEKKNMQLMLVNDQLSNLHKIIREMTQIMDLDRILGIILDGICKYLHYDHAVIFLIDENNRVLKPTHSIGFNEKITDVEISLNDKTNPIVMSVMEKRPRIIKTLNNSLKLYSNIKENNIIAVIPLEARSKIIGVVIVDNISSKRVITENDLRDLLVFTNQAGLAIENARLYETEKKFKEELQRQVDIAIKKLQETQAQLIQSEKLAALGEMAAIVTHEVRNPLSTIRGSTELINETIPDNHPSKKYISFVIQEVDRLNRIVTDILSFSAVPKPIFNKVNINNIIEQICLFLEASDFVKYNVQCYKDLDPNIPIIQVDIEQIKQVLLNIIQNACHFMTNSKIRQIEIKTYFNTTHVFISISDTGPGIPPENINKIFEPFFTTKVKGTGLGLSISKNIINAHKGEITVKSKLGVGSTFIISLPITQQVS